MNIVFIDPMMGGSLAIYDMSLLTNLTSDCNVTILGSSLYEGGDVKDNITFKPVFTYNRKSGIKKLISYLNSLRIVYKEVKRIKPDVIHIQWLKIHGLDSKFYLFLQRKFKSKIVFTAHNILPHDTGDKYKAVYESFYKNIEAIIVHDKNTKALLCGEFGIKDEKVNVLPHGLILFKGNEKNIEKEKRDILSRYELKDDVLVFSSMGVQGRYKGSDVLIDVWTCNPQLYNNPKCVLVFAGQCGSLDMSKLAGATNVIVENGLLNDDRFNAIMCRTDVLVLPYRQISQSGVNMTAINFRIPVLVTNVGGLADPLTVGHIGWVIENCDKALLEEMMVRLVQNPEEVRRVKSNNDTEWEKVQEAYSWKGIGKDTSELYKRLVKQ